MPIAAARTASLLLAVIVTVVGCRRAPEARPSAEQAAEPPAQMQPGLAAPPPAQQAVPPVAEAPAPDAPAAALVEEGSPVAALADGTAQPAAGPQPVPAPQPEQAPPRHPGQPECTEAGAAKTPAAERFKKDVACRIHSRNTGDLYDGAPPPVLRSVVVLSVRIDAKGKPVRIVVVRSNGIRELERRAIQSVRSAVPLPLPGALAQRQGSAEITETWLFRDDGRFRVRTLAAVQAPSGL